MNNQAQHFHVVRIPNTNMFDVFSGKGWNNWSRVLVKADFVHIIKGERIPAKILYRLFDTEQKEKYEFAKSLAIH